ncbi:MAG: hypothetical protein ACOC6F_03335 [bacterium]
MGDVSAGEIIELVKTDDPVSSLFHRLVELWDVGEVDAAVLSDYYEERERVTRRLTWTLEQIYGEFLPDVLRPQVGSRQVAELLGEPRHALVVMDSLSLREACLLKERLPRHGYEVGSLDYGFSELPSDTETFCQRHWQTDAPSAINDPTFVYVRPDALPEELSGDRIVAWGTYPDWFWRHAHSGKTEHIPPREIYQRSETMLLAILDAIQGHEQMIVSSDHGYLGVKAGMAWTTPKPYYDYLRDVMGSRTAPVSDSKKARALLEKNLIVVHEGRFLVKGRYTGDFGGVYLHGGLSLMECLTPWMVVERLH